MRKSSLCRPRLLPGRRYADMCRQNGLSPWEGQRQMERIAPDPNQRKILFPMCFVTERCSWDATWSVSPAWEGGNLGRGGCWGVWMMSWGEEGEHCEITDVGTSWVRSLEEDESAREPISGFNNSLGDNQPHEKGAGRRVRQRTVAPPACNMGFL